jgi:hypothetical protein
MRPCWVILFCHALTGQDLLADPDNDAFIDRLQSTTHIELLVLIWLCSQLNKSIRKPMVVANVRTSLTFMYASSLGDLLLVVLGSEVDLHRARKVQTNPVRLAQKPLSTLLKSKTRTQGSLLTIWRGRQPYITAQLASGDVWALVTQRTPRFCSRYYLVVSKMGQKLDSLYPEKLVVSTSSPIDELVEQ